MQLGVESSMAWASIQRGYKIHILVKVSVYIVPAVGRKNEKKMPRSVNGIISGSHYVG